MHKFCNDNLTYIIRKQELYDNTESWKIKEIKEKDGRGEWLGRAPEKCKCKHKFPKHDKEDGRNIGKRFIYINNNNFEDRTMYNIVLLIHNNIYLYIIYFYC